jgi:hypothetical protein
MEGRPRTEGKVGGTHFAYDPFDGVGRVKQPGRSDEPSLSPSRHHEIGDVVRVDIQEDNSCPAGGECTPNLAEIALDEEHQPAAEGLVQHVTVTREAWLTSLERAKKPQGTHPRIDKPVELGGRSESVAQVYRADWQPASLGEGDRFRIALAIVEPRSSPRTDQGA